MKIQIPRKSQHESISSSSWVKKNLLSELHVCLIVTNCNASIIIIKGLYENQWPLTFMCVCVCLVCQYLCAYVCVFSFRRRHERRQTNQLSVSISYLEKTHERSSQLMKREKVEKPFWSELPCLAFSRPKTQIWPFLFKIGWPRNFREFVKWLVFFLVHRSLYSIKSKFFLS